MVFEDTAVVTLVVPQAIEIKEPQLPLNTSIFGPEVVKSDPTEGSVTVKLFEKVDVVILYQTSSSGTPVHPPVTPLVAVAFQTVPELLVTPLVNVVAPLQSSFDGGGIGWVRQMSNFGF